MLNQVLANHIDRDIKTDLSYGIKFKFWQNILHARVEHN